MQTATRAYSTELRSIRERLAQTSINDAALAVFLTGIARIEEAIERPLRVVILGEYNSGKTSVADLLLGDGVLPTSVVSNTRVPVLIRYGDTPAIQGMDNSGTSIRIDGGDDPLTDLPYRAVQVSLPLDTLRGYQILDTPSMQSPDEFVSDSDIAIWCTVATRAWTESERAVWSGLPQRCFRHGLLVATHKDGLQGESECLQVTQRLRSHAGALFRDVVLVSAETADTAVGGADGGDAGSGAEMLKQAVQRAAEDIVDRRALKGERIVRRLARLTLHSFAADQVRPEAAILLDRWESHADAVLRRFEQGAASQQDTVGQLLAAYAAVAEKLRPGAVKGAGMTGSSGRAAASPEAPPARSPRSLHEARMLAQDLTALLRMLAGQSPYADPAVRSEYEVARAILFRLSDLDRSFEALGTLIGTHSAAAPAQI